MLIKKLLFSFYHAFQGIGYCIYTQRNMKIHFLAAGVVFLLAWWFEFNQTEMMILVLTVAGVIALEMVNTSLETVVDIVSPEYKPLAKIAKDTAAGAVLIAAICSIIIGYYLFFERLKGV